MRGGAAAGEHHGRPRGAVQRGGLGRGQVAGHEDAVGACRRGRARRQRAEHLVADGTDVGGAGPQVRVGQRAQLGARRRRGGGPGASGRRAAVDAGRAAPSSVGVVEQQEVGVEDRRLRRRRRRAPSAARSRVDVAAHVGDGLDEPPPLRAGRRPVGGTSTATGATASRCRSDRRCPETPAAGLPRRRGRRRRRAQRSTPSIGLVEAATGEARTWSRAACACRPVALTWTTWPRSAPRVATRLRLAAGTGPVPVVRLRRVTAASSLRTSPTSRAAGRACSPCRFSTVNEAGELRRAGPRRPARRPPRGARWADLPGERRGAPRPPPPGARHRRRRQPRRPPGLRRAGRGRAAPGRARRRRPAGREPVRR